MRIRIGRVYNKKKWFSIKRDINNCSIDRKIDRIVSHSSLFIYFPYICFVIDYNFNKKPFCDTQHFTNWLKALPNSRNTSRCLGCNTKIDQCYHARLDDYDHRNCLYSREEKLQWLAVMKVIHNQKTRGVKCY